MTRLDSATASDLVRLIRSQSGFHAIICDTSATIIADSAGTRVGTQHAGAKRLLTTDLDCISVTEAEAAASGGQMKEGFNLAVRSGRQKIGTFGVAGKLEVVEPIARIAAALVVAQLQDKEVADGIRRLAADMGESLQQATKAGETLTATSAKLAATSRNAEGVTQRTAAEVQQTGQILDLIKGVAQQTRLLSFNAAIEAGRAGESGRGFAVVAGEIRQLSARTGESVDSIEAMLRRFQCSVDEVLVDVREASGIAQTQAQAAAEIARRIEGLRGIAAALKQAAARKGGDRG